MIRVKYDFDTIIDRSNNYSSKWDELEVMFGSKDVLPMWVADMDFKSPQPVIDAIVKRAEQGIFGYTSRPDTYHEAIINWFAKRYQWEVKEDWFVYSPGVVPALSFIINTFTKPGDKIIVQPPVYYPFFQVIENNGCQVVTNPLKLLNQQYVMDYEDLEVKLKESQAKLLLLSSPHNPGGRVWHKEELRKLGEICLRHGVLVISDEIHGDLIFKGNKHIPFASITEEFAQNSITCTAPSKTFNLAGLQTSNIIIPNQTLREKFASTMTNFHLKRNNAFGLVALEAAYKYGEEWLEQLIAYLEGNLDYLVEYFAKRIKQIKVIKPEGTYLVWLDCRELGLTTQELNDFMIKEAQVALDSGVWFGQGGQGFMRINIACPRALLEEGIKRIEKAVKLHFK